VFTQTPLTPIHEAIHHFAQQAQSIRQHSESPYARREEAINAQAAREAARPPRNALQGALRAMVHQEIVQRGAEQAEANRKYVLQQMYEQRQKEREGRGGIRIGLPGASVNLTPLATALATMKVPGLGGIPGKLVNEVIDLPGQTFLSGAIAGRAGREAIEGNTAPGEALLSSIEQQALHPVRSLEQAPLSTALMLAGGENVLGRLGGAVARTGALGERAAELASTERPALQLYGGLTKEQAYNSDPLRKAAQVAYERSLTRLPGSLRQRDPFLAEGWRLNHNLIGGWLHPGRMDYEAGAMDIARRGVVKQSVVPKAEGLKSKVGAEAVPLIKQRVIRSPATLAEDLHKRLAQLEDVRPTLRKAQLDRNQRSIDQVRALLADEKFMADPHEAFAAANKAITDQRPLTAYEVTARSLRPEQVRAALHPYAITHMGAEHMTPQELARLGDTGARYGGLRTPEGEPLSNEEIEAHMLEHGVPAGPGGKPLVGFISHQENIAGPGSFYRSILRQPTLHRFTRTGESFRKGLNDESFAGMVGSLAKQASRVAQHEGQNSIISNLVQGHYETPEQARLEAENYNHPESTLPDAQVAQQLGGMVPINKGTNQILEAGLTHEPRDITAELESLGLEHHTPAHVAEGIGKYGLIPRDVLRRLEKHQEAASAKGGFQRFAQAYTQAFRHVKFATSPKHMAGVTEESLIRPAMEGAGPVSRQVGAVVQRHLADLAQQDAHGRLLDIGPQAAEFRKAQGYLSGRGMVGSMKQQDIVRKIGSWDETSALAKRGELAEHSPPMKAWIAWRNLTEKGLEGIAHQSRTAVFGKMLKESGFIPSAWEFLRMQDEVQRELVRGIAMDPNKVDLLARKLDDAAGNWNHLTPAVKAAVSKGMMPFGLWWLNSLRWLYRLPVTHPVKTGILAAVYQATRDARNAEGQGFGAANVGTKENPNYLQGTIPATLPLLGDVRIDLGHYSPLGIAGPEAPGTAAEMIAPQFQGILSALEGTDSLTHEKATQPNGAELTGPQKALNALSEGFVTPLLPSQVNTLLTGGGKPYGTSNLITDIISRLGGPATVRPGTEEPLGKILSKSLSPLRTFKNRQADAVSPQKAIEKAEGTSAGEDPVVKAATERAIERAVSGG
jgi:hypothetical protein